MTISLDKRVEAVGIQLEKHAITKVPAIRVGLALDVSGSIQSLYENGTMQETVNRLQAIALKFDDNGELDMWTFSNGSDQVDTATAEDYDNYVQEKILENDDITLWQGTDYAPVLGAMMDFWFPSPTQQVRVPETVQVPVAAEEPSFLGKLFGKKVTAATTRSETRYSNQTQDVSATWTAEQKALYALPAMGLIVTDGANSDRAAAAAILAASVNKNVYWQMIGVGPESQFGFIKDQADLLPNVGFVNLSHLNISDEELYSALIAEEFAGWVKKFA